MSTRYVRAELAPGGRFAEWVARPVRAAFLDVDGTALGADPEPSAAVVDACRALQATGIAVGFATGRLPRGLTRLREHLGGAGVDVVHNGAQVVHDGAALATWPLPRSVSVGLGRWCMRHGVYAEFFADPHFYVTDEREEARPSWKEVSGPPDGRVAELDLRDLDVIKVTINAFDPDQLPAILAASAAMGATVELSSSPLFVGVPVVNVTAAGVTKGTGLAWAARRLGTALPDVLVVGDGLNDVSMFHIAGTAIAMGDAPEAVKAAAHLVTVTFEQDGLAVALRARINRDPMTRSAH
jgi:hypothetical protein